MAFCCGTKLSVAPEIAECDPVYEDTASRYFEHFVAIANAMNRLGGNGLYHTEDGWLFGGNSDRRGPVWLPLNYLMIEALERYHHFCGDGFTLEFPTGGGWRLILAQIAQDLPRRLVTPFPPDGGGRPTGAGDRGSLCERAELAGADVVPRVFPRGRGPRLGRGSSDGLDDTGDAVDRGVAEEIGARRGLHIARGMSSRFARQYTQIFHELAGLRLSQRQGEYHYPNNKIPPQ